MQIEKPPKLKICKIKLFLIRLIVAKKFWESLFYVAYVGDFSRHLTAEYEKYMISSYMILCRHNIDNNNNSSNKPYYYCIHAYKQ